MSRIATAFESLRAGGRKALIPYITSGFPSREATLPVMHAMVAAGADAIELGVPFSDPMADGPVIQRAGERALALGVGLKDVLDYVSAFRRTNTTTPIVLMGYANPIERMGSERFLQRASEVGVDGLIVVDYPPEEGEAFARASLALGIDPIFLFAPTSTDARIDRMLQVAAGYVYYVSLKGITGGTLDQSDVIKRVANLRTRTALPIAVGFGIRDGATARAISQFADGVIIGTRMIQVLEDGEPATAPARATAFIAEIRKAMDS